MCSTGRTRVKGMVDGSEKAHKIIYKTLCTETLHEYKMPRISTWYDNRKLKHHKQKTANNIQIETFKARA